MATDKTGEAQGSSSSGKAGGGKNISALLKKLKGKINKNSGDQANLQKTANTGLPKGGGAPAAPSFGPTSNPDMPFVGVQAQDYLVKDKLKGFGFGTVQMDLGNMQPLSFGGAPTGGTVPNAPFTTPPAFGAPVVSTPTPEEEGED